MKKSLVLIFLMMMSWNCFSQTVTKDSSIQLEKTVAKFIIKDLILGDGFKEELFLTDNKIQLLNQKIILKDSIILSLTSKNDNFETILFSKQNQLDLSQELSKKLQTDLKKQKAKTKLMGGAGILLAGAAVLILK
tara:strand:+ start:85 stop:489 length:405 start_codon:yes stop_codon:yes gene_type:complete